MLPLQNIFDYSKAKDQIFFFIQGAKERGCGVGVSCFHLLGRFYDNSTFVSLDEQNLYCSRKTRPV